MYGNLCRTCGTAAYVAAFPKGEIIGAECVPFWTDFDMLAEQSKKLQPVAVPELFMRMWNGLHAGPGQQ